MNDIWKISHAIKHSHGRCVLVDLDKISHEGYIWDRHRSFLSFILQKSVFLHFVHHDTKFYKIYINDDNRNIYILIFIGVVSNQNRRLEHFIIQIFNRYMATELILFPLMI